MVPLPTPPGPIKTTTSGLADKSVEELFALTRTEPADPTRLGNGGNLHDARSLHFTDRGERGNEVVGAHLCHAFFGLGQRKDFFEGELTTLHETLHLGTATSVGDSNLRGRFALRLSK